MVWWRSERGSWSFWPAGANQPDWWFLPDPRGRRWFGPPPGPGYPGDLEIEEAVYANLDADPAIPWDADIRVLVEGGEVLLWGTVPNKLVKHAAGEDAWWVPGVVDVRNELRVVRGSAPYRTAASASRASSA